MPLVGIATAFFLLGETISAAQMIGGLIIFSGLAIVSFRRHRQSSPAEVSAAYACSDSRGMISTKLHGMCR